MIDQDHELERTLVMSKLLRMCRPAIEDQKPIRAKLAINNINRVVGTLVGSEVTRRYGESGLPDNTIKLNFEGSAGQSFGAFIPKGMTLELEGDANDYLGNIRLRNLFSKRTKTSLSVTLPSMVPHLVQPTLTVLLVNVSLFVTVVSLLLWKA